MVEVNVNLLFIAVAFRKGTFRKTKVMLVISKQMITATLKVKFINFSSIYYISIIIYSTYSIQMFVTLPPCSSSHSSDPPDKNLFLDTNPLTSCYNNVL